MEFDQVIAATDATLVAKVARHLSDLEIELLRGAWDNLTYEAIAANSGYSLNYLQRDIGPKFWKLLSDLYGCKLNKTNARAILTRQAAAGEQLSPVKPAVSVQAAEPPAPPSSRLDWGEAPDVTAFYGCTAELDTLAAWLGTAGQGCRLVALLGMGGIGKSFLAARAAHDLQDRFDGVIWRSLRNAPSLERLLQDLVPFASHQQDTAATPERLLHWLRRYRYLLILDNWETLLQPGDRVGVYQPGYEPYGGLLRLLGETPHRSCVLLTSREKPEEVIAFETEDGPVRSLPLAGSWEASLAFIELQGLVGSDADKRQLCQFYTCSPLALKIVAASIQSLFAGDIGAFLVAETMVFNGLRRLLEQQFERLSTLEQIVMYWLAINREWVDIATLQTDIVPQVSRMDLLEALESLTWRSLIENRAGRYTQQPVVMEYVLQRLVNQFTADVEAATDLTWFSRCALMTTTVKDYIREAQERLILQPVAQHLQATFNSQAALEQQVLRLLMTLRRLEPKLSGYGPGNLINVLRHLPVDLTGFDFSDLTLRHVNLQNLTLHRVNFAHARFISPLFTYLLASIFAIAFSPDGELLATGVSTGEVCLWRPGAAQPHRTLEGHANRVLALAFSPDGRCLASASADGTVKLWDMASGQPITTLEGHRNSVCAISFSPDGRWLASASMDGTIRLWDGQSYAWRQDLRGHQDWVWAVCFCPQGDRPLLVSGSADTTLKLWDAASGELLNTLEGHRDRVWSVAISPDGATLASASEDRTVRLWDLASGRLQRTLVGHQDIVWTVDFSPDGALLASGSSDQTVRLWKTATGDLWRTLGGHSNRVAAVSFSPRPWPPTAETGPILASGGADFTVKLWDIQTGQILRTLQGYTNGVRALAFAPSGSLLASSTTADPEVKLWDLNTGQLVNTLPGHHQPIHSLQCCALASGGDLLASGGADRTVKLWELPGGQLIRTLQGHTATLWAVGLHPRGDLCASAGADSTIRVWEVATGQLLHQWQDPRGWVWALAVCPQGRLLASGGADSQVKLWDLRTGHPRHTLSGHGAWIRSVSFSPDGHLLASGSADCTVKLWDVATGALCHTLRGHSSWVWQVSFSPDGRLLASGSADRTVKLWDVATGALCRTLVGHRGEVWAVSFSPDGQLLASSGADETIRLWDPDSGHCRQIMESDRPYAGINITGATGLTAAERANLRALGAIDT